MTEVGIFQNFQNENIGKRHVRVHIAILGLTCVELSTILIQFVA